MLHVYKLSISYVSQKCNRYFIKIKGTDEKFIRIASAVGLLFHFTNLTYENERKSQK